MSKFAASEGAAAERAASEDAASEHPVRLSRPGRAARLVATIVVLACLTIGTLVGDDDAFPFGPFRMYSTANKPDGAVTYFSIEARVAGGSWERAALSPRNVGMNRAEVEGQIPKIIASPSRLATLAEARRRLRPGEPAWTGVRLLRNRSILEDRKPTGEIERTVMAAWETR